MFVLFTKSDFVIFFSTIPLWRSVLRIKTLLTTVCTTAAREGEEERKEKKKRKKEKKKEVSYTWLDITGTEGRHTPVFELIAVELKVVPWKLLHHPVNLLRLPHQAEFCHEKSNKTGQQQQKEQEEHGPVSEYMK